MVMKPEPWAQALTAVAAGQSEAPRTPARRELPMPPDLPASRS